MVQPLDLNIPQNYCRFLTYGTFGGASFEFLKRKNSHQFLTFTGLIGMVEPPALLTASAALNAFHVPVVAVTPGFYARWAIMHLHHLVITLMSIIHKIHICIYTRYNTYGSRV